MRNANESLIKAAPEMKDRLDLAWDILSGLAERGKLDTQEHEEVVGYLESLSEMYQDHDLPRPEGGA